MNCKRCSARCYGEFCFRCKPRKALKRTPVKKIGKRTISWNTFRITLPKLIPPDHAGYWYCHYCKVALTIQTITWEHMHGRDGSLLTDLRYIVPCCAFDNSRKGSRSYENYCREFYPHLLDNL